MRRSLRSLFYGLIFLFVLFLCFRKVSFLVERKASMEKYQPFYDQKEPFDVLVIGTSHAINGIFPMELWDDYGIVSYNFGGHDNQPATSYWVLRNALEYTTPGLVVLDVFGAASKGKVSDDLAYLHLSTDSMPFSKTKVEMLTDILPDYAHKYEYLFNFTLYHNRWNELTEDDFSPDFTKEKGAESRINVGEPLPFELISRDRRFEEESLGKEYICKIIELCKDKGIEIVLVNLPFPASEQKQMNANSVFPIAEKYGVEYINYLYREGIVDFDTDVYDTDAHLNPSGARKVTHDLGRILQQKYGVPDRRSDPDYQEWYTDYEEYTEFKIENLKKQENMENYLMLLYDDSFDCKIKITGADRLTNQKLLKKLLQNIAGNIAPGFQNRNSWYLNAEYSKDNMEWFDEENCPESFSEDFKDLPDGQVSVLVFDNRSGEMIDRAVFDGEGRLYSG